MTAVVPTPDGDVCQTLSAQFASLVQALAKPTGARYAVSSPANLG